MESEEAEEIEEAHEISDAEEADEIPKRKSFLRLKKQKLRNWKRLKTLRRGARAV